MNIAQIIGRERMLFDEDILHFEDVLSKEVSRSRFLVLGGAGSIGQAVVKELFKRNPVKLHVVDISENNLVELVRDVRSSLGYILGDFKTFALDIQSAEFDQYCKEEREFDYVLNLSALKHVRSEKDPFTLMRMVQVNILNTIKTLDWSVQIGAKKYFCVSTDKAANPVNMMGASKRIMELFLHERSKNIQISTARFANVAFSDGSLLHGFIQRLNKLQPIVAPNDVRRYFVTPEEAGLLCLFSTILGDNNDIFFPKLSEDLHLTKFSDIAVAYLQQLGKHPVMCTSEEEARDRCVKMKDNEWPCYFSPSDTTGEKDFEEFFRTDERVEWNRFAQLGIVKNNSSVSGEALEVFLQELQVWKAANIWSKQSMVKLFQTLIPEFEHEEKGKYLDAKM
ncbi:MAG: UDP-N-acetylglucosamine 4,6-dehydratase [Bacteroidetes bacterium]|nr:UDP-N-acetylglucosamine 4,6-dehydratase [Bacteroidota bacterium]